MEVQFNKTEHYEHNYTVEFKGFLNDAVWYFWDHTHDCITIAHDTDEAVIDFCEKVGDEIEVWIDGDRTICTMEIEDHTWMEGKRVLVNLPVYAHEDAEYNGPYDGETNVDIHR